MHIYPIDLLNYHRKYIVTAPTDMDINKQITKFLKVAKMDTKKYAGKLFTSILTSFLDEIEDVENIYKKYYSKEYANVKDYMYKKMLMEDYQIEYIYSKIKDGESIFFVDLQYTSDNNYENLFEYEEEDLLLKLNNTLEKIL